MKKTVIKYVISGSEEHSYTEQDGVVIESEIIKKDSFGRVLSISVNNRKVEFEYPDREKENLLFDLAEKVIVREVGEDGKTRVKTGNGSIEIKGNLIFYRIPQFFGLTDDEPIEYQQYLSIYLINSEKTHKGLISEKIFVNHGDNPDTERYISYYDDNFEKKSLEVCVNSGIFTPSIKTYTYDNLGREQRIDDLIENTTLISTYENDQLKKTRIFDNRLGGIENEAASLITEISTSFDENGNIFRETILDYSCSDKEKDKE